MRNNRTENVQRVTRATNCITPASPRNAMRPRLMAGGVARAARLAPEASPSAATPARQDPRWPSD
eukprot:7671291-Pyramimonas_sp.AAC.1